MPIYIVLYRWTDKGRTALADIPKRLSGADERMEALGCRLLGHYVTMGRFDQVSILEAPNDEVVASLALRVAASGNVVTETMRAFTVDEVSALVGPIATARTQESHPAEDASTIDK